jgi:uncharacterized protein DUF5317
LFTLFLLALSLALALLRGGRLTSLFELPIRHLWLFFLPFALQLAVFSPLRSALPLGSEVDRLLYFASLLTAAVALWLNRHLPGLTWIAAGLVLNLLVISLNGGFMPVAGAARSFAGLPPLSARDANVIPMTETTLLPWLGDTLPLPAWLPFANVYSPGDVLVAIGGVLFIQRNLTRVPASLASVSRD